MQVASPIRLGLPIHSRQAGLNDWALQSKRPLWFCFRSANRNPVVAAAAGTAPGYPQRLNRIRESSRFVPGKGCRTRPDSDRYRRAGGAEAARCGEPCAPYPPRDAEGGSASRHDPGPCYFEIGGLASAPSVLQTGEWSEFPCRETHNRIIRWQMWSDRYRLPVATMDEAQADVPAFATFRNAHQMRIRGATARPRRP